MPDYRRARVQGGSYFFTVTTYRRQPVLTHVAVRQALREGIERVREEYPFKIEAWVLLSDHLHALWTLPEGDANFSGRWAGIKRHVSQSCAALFTTEAVNESRQKRKELMFWQRRFWEHQIRDEEDYIRHIDYIHWNPVKHGYVKKVTDWPYSTFHRYVKQGVYTVNWGGAVGLEEGHDEEFGE